MTKRRFTTFPLLLAILLLLASCSSAKAAEDSEVKEELAQTFMRELWNDILPLREQKDALPTVGVMVTENEKTIGGEYLDAFYASYEAGQPCQLTAAFYGATSLVVIRLDVVSENEGYYSRYVFTNGNEPMSVTSKVFSSLTLVDKPEIDNTSLNTVISDNATIKKMVLSVVQGKTELAAFTFYNIVED